MILLFATFSVATAGPFDSDPLRERFKHKSPPLLMPDAPSTGWDIEHYDIAIELDPYATRVTGRIAITARPLDGAASPLLLHADGPELLSVTADEQDLDFEQIEDEVHITVPATDESVEVVVTYAAEDTTGDAQTGLQWGEPIYSLNEPSGARHWLVVYDEPNDKATLQWHVTAPAELVVIANGEPLGAEATDDGKLRWDFDFPWPIASYLMVIHAGDYVGELDDSGSVPVWTWGYPELIDQMTSDLSETSEMLDVLSDRFGPYPWTLYQNVAAPFGGGMEHTTATTFGEGLVGTTSTDWVNVHEAGHHWWGDFVTCAEWPEIWLNEGFASYSEVLWAEQIGGEPLRQEYTDWQRSSYLGWQSLEAGSTLYDPSFMWGGTVYDKGSLVLHMLRTVVGDEAFFAGLALYGERHAHSVATTPDLEAAMEDASGQSLDWFFDQWVYTPGDPTYITGLTTRELPDGGYQVDVHVLQAGGVWRMPVEYEIALDNGDTITDRQWVEQTSQAFSYCTDAPPQADPDSSFVFDPNVNLLYAQLYRDDDNFVHEPDVCSPPKACGCASTATPVPALTVLVGLFARRRARSHTVERATRPTRSR